MSISVNLKTVEINSLVNNLSELKKEYDGIMGLSLAVATLGEGCQVNNEIMSLANYMRRVNKDFEISISELGNS